jgi:hypothetical protein
MIANGDVESDIKIIIEAEQFQSSVVGETGEKSEITQAFFRLADNPRSSSIFINIFEKSKTEAAKSYAMYGLFYADKKQYLSKREVWGNEGKIKTKFFGVTDVILVGKMKKMIESGEIRRILGWSK